MSQVIVCCGVGGAGKTTAAAALGVGLASMIQGRNPMIEGFGLIAFASLMPIVFVLIFGIVTSAWS